MKEEKIYTCNFNPNGSVGVYKGSITAKTNTQLLNFGIHSYDDDYDTIYSPQIGPFESGNGKYYENYYVREND